MNKYLEPKVPKPSLNPTSPGSIVDYGNQTPPAEQKGTVKPAPKSPLVGE